MTDDRLKQALAKMMPDAVQWNAIYLWWVIGAIPEREDMEVLDTELLHLCSLAEGELAKDKWAWLPYANALNDLCADEWLLASIRATWQQRVTVLAAVKGITI